MMVDIRSYTIASLAMAVTGSLIPAHLVAQSLERPPTVSEQGETIDWTPMMQMRIKRILNPRISPSGRLIAFDIAHADFEEDRWVRQVNIKPWDKSRRQPQQDQCLGCWDAQWGATDSAIFARALDDDKHERLYLVDLKTGTRQPITPGDAQVGWFHPSPTGEWLAYTTLIHERWQLRVIAISDGRTKVWETERSVGEFSWSPSGDRLVAVYLPTSTLDWRQKSLAVLDFKEDAPISLKTGPGAAWMPQFGPRGRQIAFVASPGEATWMMDSELRVLDLESGKITSLASTPDRNVDLLAWHPHEPNLIGLEYDGSNRRILSVPLDGSPVKYLGPSDRSFGETDVSVNGIAFTSERWDEPPEVFAAEWPTWKEKQISSAQSKPTAPIGHTTLIRWQSDDGTEIEGYLTLPVGYRVGTRVPLLVRLHGGPPFPVADTFLGGTHMTAYPLASLASAGFAILQPNFRGSAGYGLDFRRDLHADWGGQDYRDVMAGVTELIERGVADPYRMGIMGWSYGGYLTAWTVTQNDRFAAASMGAAMTDLALFDETTSLGKGFLFDWMGGTKGSRIADYRQRSPITFAQNVRCPVLVQHGRHDTTVPIAQASVFAEAMKQAGVEFELVTYEGGHGPRTPSIELAVLSQNLDWFVRLVRDRKANAAATIRDD